MRIIAGAFRSRRLSAPDGMETRPTADKVREALFSILYDRVYGARVLDLYAGSGALALEAISRGAKNAVLADCAPKAWKAIAANIGALGCENQAELLRCGDVAAMTLLENRRAAFDLIFLDPPYRMDVSPVCARLAQGGLLADGGLIVAEHSRSTPPNTPDCLRLTDRREYGVTGLSFYERIGEE